MAKPRNKNEQAPQAFLERLELASHLTPEEKEQIRIKAKEHVQEALKNKAAEQYLEQSIKEEERKLQPALEMETVLIDLPGHSVMITLDNTGYYHGYAYEVPKQVADTMREVMFRAWAHEDEIGQANRDVYRKPSNRPMNVALSPRNPSGSPLAV